MDGQPDQAPDRPGIGREERPDPDRRTVPADGTDARREPAPEDGEPADGEAGGYVPV
jgi:hypothetical protein